MITCIHKYKSYFILIFTNLGSINFRVDHEVLNLGYIKHYFLTLNINNMFLQDLEPKFLPGFEEALE